MTPKVARVEVGMASAGITALRGVCRKSRITSTTRMPAITSELSTSSTDSSMKRDESKLICRRWCGGSVGVTTSISFRTARATSTVFAFDCFRMPSETCGRRLKRAIERSFSSPSSAMPS